LPPSLSWHYQPRQLPASRSTPAAARSDSDPLPLQPGFRGDAQGGFGGDARGRGSVPEAPLAVRSRFSDPRRARGERGASLRALLASPRPNSPGPGPGPESPGLARSSMHGTQVQGMRNGGRMPHWPPTAANAAKARERERERSQLLKSRRSLLVAYLGLSRQPSIGLPPSNHDAEAEGSSKQQSPYRPRIRGRSARSPPGLLSQQEVESVHAELPLRHRLCDWQLL